MVFQLRRILWMAVIAMGLSATGPAATSLSAQQPAATDTANAADAAVYRLGTGDRLRITVYNEARLSGEFDVDSAGNVSVPLIGNVPAAGRTSAELAAEIETRLRGGYLTNPSVAIDMVAYRPFYILGEVREPGKFPYVVGLTVTKAVAMAGGYTYRGKKSHAFLTRTEAGRASERKVPVTADVQPGDVVRVPERHF